MLSFLVNVCFLFLGYFQWRAVLVRLHFFFVLVVFFPRKYDINQTFHLHHVAHIKKEKEKEIEKEKNAGLFSHRKKR